MENHAKAVVGADRPMKTTLSEALQHAGEFFMERSPIHQAALRISKTLAGMQIPFAVGGALAAAVHGHVRMTEDVDILLTREGLAAFKKRWLGRGWVEIFPGLKGMRDTEHGVKIDVMLAGDYPGDGKPKPVAFPDPEDAAELDGHGRPVMALRTLLELKIASGMTAVHRPQDLYDVIRLIRANELDLAYADALHPYVRDKYRELWTASQVREDY